VSQTSKVIV